MTARMDARFAKVKEEGRPALVTFVMSGDPDYDTSLAILKRLPSAGADVVELGMPFSDPMADGPAIQAGGLRALKAGQTLHRTLDMVKTFREEDADTPIVLMGYYNPIYSRGVDTFLEQARAAGFEMFCAPEVEFFYFANSDTTSPPVPLDQASYFDLTTADVASDLRKQTLHMLEALSIPVEYSFHEDSPSQHEIDLRYRQHLKQPKPATSAVMFCLMDVSGSMTQMHKDIAKRFFILLYLFLKKNYKKIEVVFIRHHTSAKEVDEEEFFYSRETGGTIVSSALKLTRDIIEERYPVAEWNLYAAQASDGDNWNDDSPACAKLIEDELLPKLQYFSYVEVMPRAHQALWDHYQNIMQRHPSAFSMAQIDEPGEIYPVFRELFKKRMET